MYQAMLLVLLTSFIILFFSVLLGVGMAFCMGWQKEQCKRESVTSSELEGITEMMVEDIEFYLEEQA